MMATRTLRRYIIGRLWRLASNGKSTRFPRRFNLVNNLILRTPISCHSVNNYTCFKVLDSYGKSLHFSNPSMIRRYEKGIQHRLELLARQYLLDLIPIRQGDVCVDVGANIGEVAVFLAERYEAKIVAVDPERQVLESLRRNLEGKSCVIVERALWSHEAELTLFHAPGSNDTSVIEPAEYDSVETVKATTLDKVLSSSEVQDLVGTSRIKLVKIEAEGAEPEIIKGGESLLRLTDYVVADCGPERGVRSESTLVDVVRSLQDLDFDLIGFEPQRSVVAFRSRFTLS